MCPDADNKIVSVVPNDLLDLSKIEVGNLALDALRFDLWDVADGAMQAVAERVRTKAVELACWIQPEAPRGMIGDPVSLHQIMVDLLASVVKAAPNRGEILLHVAVEEEDESSVTLRLALSVDGVEAHQLDETGLPLPASRELVRAMGGEIGVTSFVDSGCTLWFTVRLEKQSQGEEVAPALPFRALVLNGRPAIRRFLSNQLRSLGVRNSAVANVAEAVDLLSEGKTSDPFNLLVVDLSLPLNRSLETIRGILSGEHSKGLAVIVLLPKHEPNAQEFLKRRGAIACLVKPVSHGVFSETLLEFAKALDGNAVKQALDTPPEKRDMPGKLSGRVLLVEDNPVNRKVATLQLAKLGMESDAVCDGFEAVEAARNRRYDIVLMDCQLPGMDGLEATRKIREHESACASANGNQRTPIIAMTAGTLDADRQNCLEAGMDDFLTKPVNMEELRGVLEHWMSDSRPAVAPPVAAKVIAGVDNPASKTLEEPVVDLRRLWDCADDDQRQLRELLAQYFRETESQLTQMEAAIAAGDCAEMSRRAHRCCGGSAIIGMKTIVIPLRAIENLGRESSMKGVEALAADARKQFALIREYLKSHPETTACYP